MNVKALISALVVVGCVHGGERSRVVVCEALCDFRRADGAIERLELEATGADVAAAWKKLVDRCAGVTCRGCASGLLVSVPATLDLRPATVTQDCKGL